MKGKISISTGELIKKYGLEGAFDIAGQIGADGIDFDLSPEDYTNPDSIYSKDEEEFTKYFKKIRVAAESRGLKICQTHGRAVPFRENADEYNNVIFPKNSEFDCKATKILGAPFCVVHPGGTLSNLNATAEEMRTNARKALSFSVPFAKKYGIKIALETVGANWQLDNQIDFFGAYDEFRSLYDYIALDPELKDSFCCCIDTGHINLAVQHNQPTPADFIRLMGDNVACLHMHDNTGYVDQHRIIWAGTIDWKDVFKALSEIGYSGYYNSETDFKYISPNLMKETADITVKTIKNFVK